LTKYNQGHWIQFGTEYFPDWESVLKFIEVYGEDDEPKLHHRFITSSLVEKTIKSLDAYMELLNAKCEKEFDQELYKKVTDLATLTNRWLKASGVKSESSYYDI
jgi:hypothetical protein